MSKGPKARGSSRARDRLIIELDRLTGCGGDVLARELYNSGWGALSDEPGDRDASKAITGGGRAIGGRRRDRRSDVLRVHYVEISREGQDAGGVAVFYHPQSQALQIKYRKPGHRRTPTEFVRGLLKSALAALPARGEQELTRPIEIIEASGGPLRNLHHPTTGALLQVVTLGENKEPYVPIVAEELPVSDPERLLRKLASNWNGIGWRPFEPDRTKPARLHRPPTGRFDRLATVKEMEKRLRVEPPEPEV